MSQKIMKMVVGSYVLGIAKHKIKKKKKNTTASVTN